MSFSLTSACRLGPSADYVVINLSSPNTPGLRDLQRVESMRRILLACSEARDNAIRSRTLSASLPQQLTAPSPLLPLLVKISPDLTREEKESIARLLLALHSEGKIDGMIVSNTTVTRPASMVSPDAHEIGS
jgi:dihydroorotate dehydrogenase